jgi:putative ABC transport system permease protein
MFDLRSALRSLRASRSIGTTAVLVLALGIGATTAIFSVVHAVLLRPMPYPDPDRIVALRGDFTEWGATDVGLSGPESVDYRETSGAFAAMALYTSYSLNLDAGERPERVTGGAVTADFWRVLGAAPRLGRLFGPEEDRPGGERVVVLSDRLWRRSFAADPRVIGRRITLNTILHTVVGVMGPEARFPSYAELWMPAALLPQTFSEDERSSHYLGSIARLRDGMSIVRAQAAVDGVTRAMQQAHAGSYATGGFTVRLVPLRDHVVGGVRRQLGIVAGAVGLVLLVACANIASLLLARAEGRRREMAVRIALGATRRSLIGQLLGESVLLALVGGAAGVLVGLWGIRGLVALQPPDFPRIADVRMDTAVLAFTLGVSLLTGIAFGLAPAFHASSADAHDVLQESGRSGAGGRRARRARRFIVTGEVALTLMLLVGAGLLLRSFQRVERVNPGFRADSVLTFRLSISGNAYPTPARHTAAFASLAERLRALPGVARVGATALLPISGGGWDISFATSATSTDLSANTQYRPIVGDYLQALGVPLEGGRLFTTADDGAAPYVAVVNAALARRYFPGVDPIGRRVRLPWLGARDSVHTREIVGVVGDVHHFGLDVPVKPEMYVPAAQQPVRTMSVVLRATTAPEALVPAARRVVAEMDPALPIYEVRAMRSVLDESLASRRLVMMLLTCFAATALALTVVGVYGVIAYSVVQRTRELGVRIALGAQWRDVLALVVGEGLAMTVIGIALGTGGAFAATGVLSTWLFEVDARDPVIFGGVALALTMVALAASALPARRATRVDPMVALKD